MPVTRLLLAPTVAGLLLSACAGEARGDESGGVTAVPVTEPDAQSSLGEQSPASASPTTEASADTEAADSDATRPANKPGDTTKLGDSAGSGDTANDGDEAVASEVPAETEPPAPEALRFTAPLVGGGELDATTLADKPTVFWFWAPT